MNELKTKNRVSFKLIIILTGVVTMISLLSTIYFSSENSRSQKAILTDSIRNLAKISKLGYAAPLWHLNQNDIASLNAALMANMHVVAINIFEVKRDFFMGMAKNPNTPAADPYFLAKAYTIPPGNREINVVSDQIIHNGKIIGSFDLYYTERFINEEITRRNINVIVSFVFIAFAMVSIIFFFMEKFLVRPILDMAKVSQDISAHRNYSARVHRKSEDEIGMLYDSFNSMLEAIQHNERELEKAQNFLSNIIESMPSMLITIDEKGIITQWNHAAETTTGILANDIIGKNIWESLSIFDDYKEDIQGIIDKRAPVHFFRKRFGHQEVQYRNVSLFPLVENGIRGIVIRMDDITEIEKKEEQLRQSQKMEVIGMLAGGIAHDFNNILSGIVGTVSLLKYKIADKTVLDPNTISGYVETIEKAGRRAADMVQLLLAVSRKHDLTFTPVDLNLALEHTIKICSSTFDKSVSLRSFYAGEKAVINADPVLIEQVLLNILVNAYHAMTIMKPPQEHQGGTLTVSLRKIEADKFFYSHYPEAKESRYWAVCVQDTGVGMDASTMAKMFDPFFTTKEKGKGTGLGLVMAYNIIHQHGGFIDVYSELNYGTTITLYLPCLLVVMETEDMGGGKEEMMTQGKGLVLVVDDEPGLRELAEAILRESGYEVMLAEDGEAGIDVFRKYHSNISMVLLDMSMPKKSGREAFIEMKEINRNVKVLLTSGFRKDERVEQILNLGACGFIQKPYTMKTLSEEVFQTINRRL